MNLRLLNLIIVSSCAFILTGNSYASDLKITSYEIKTTLTSLNDNNLFVQTSLDATKKDTSLTYRLLFNSGAKVSSIFYQDSSLLTNIAHHFEGTDTILIELPPQAKYRNSLKLLFSYAFPITMNDTSILLLDRGHRWYPMIADCISKMKLTVSVPEGCEVISAGDLEYKQSTKGITTYVWQSDMPIFKIPMVVFRSGLYKQTTVSTNDNEMVIYRIVGSNSNNDTLLTEAMSMFNFCKNIFGEYPYKKLILFEFPDFEGMNIGSGMVTIGTSYINMFNQGYYDALYLSIAQQWIGASVFAKFGEPGFWFTSLSLPHYVRLMYVKQSKGEEEYNKELQGQLEKYKEFAGKENDVAILDVDFPNTKEKGLVLYAKGPYCISLLHKQMGDAQWMNFLKSLYEDYHGKILTYGDFREMLSCFDDGKVMPLFDKMMKEKGLPE